jgi:hypothetical protein
MKKIEQLDREILESLKREQAAMGVLQDSVIRTVLRSERKVAYQSARSKRTGRLWRLGLLGETTNLLGLDREVLLGALRAASAFKTDGAWQQKWAEEGREPAACALEQANAKAKPAFRNPAKALEAMKARAALNQKRIAFGSIVDKAGVADWDRDVLAGLFGLIARHLRDAERVQRWKAAGGATSAKLGPTKTSAGITRRRRGRRLAIQYPAAIPPHLARELRALGLKFDRWNLIWRGFASMPVARRAAAKAGGTVTPAPKTRGKPRKIQARRNSGNLRVHSPGDANITSEAMNKERKS